MNKLSKNYFSDIKLIHLYAKHIFQQRYRFSMNLEHIILVVHIISNKNIILLKNQHSDYNL